MYENLNETIDFSLDNQDDCDQECQENVKTNSIETQKSINIKKPTLEKRQTY